MLVNLMKLFLNILFNLLHYLYYINARVYFEICKINAFTNPLRSSWHQLAGSGSARYNAFKCLFRRSLILPQGSLFKPLAGLESKIKRSKKQTPLSLLQFCMQIQTEGGGTKCGKYNILKK